MLPKPTDKRCYSSPRKSHGRGSEQAKAVNRWKKTERGGYVYLHSAVDDFSRLAYTESLPDEKAATDRTRRSGTSHQRHDCTTV
ncbi:MAG: transposase [Sphaerisporangium sp.]|nr:transposase [Sphaerisporangium sp.]